MIRPGPLVLAAVVAVLALAISVVVWPAVATSAKLAFFALGFAAGAATVRFVYSMG